MRKVFLAVVATTFMWACSKEENPPEPSDHNPRGVIEPLENETDPILAQRFFLLRFQNNSCDHIVSCRTSVEQNLRESL